MSRRTRFRERGPGLEDLISGLERIQESGAVEAGYLDDPELAQIAEVHERGSRTIPARPTMRPTAESKRREWAANMRTALDRMLDGVPARVALADVGEVMVDDLRAAQVALRTPPNDPETLEDKQGNNPLVDTGALQDGLSWRIRRG